MKKTLLALTLAALSGGAAADTVLGIYAGAGNWQASYDGEAGGRSGSNSADLDDLNINDSDNVFVYVALEHPVPLIPNLRLAHTKVQTDGTGTLTSEFTLDERTFTADSEVLTDLDITHTDGTLYYELLDNWVSFDVGVTARLFDGHVEVSDEDGNSERVDFSETIPMVYTKAQFDLPLTGWHLAGGGNFVGYNGDSFSDLEAKIGYMSDGLLLDFGLDVGYRRMHVDISENSDLHADFTVDGPFIEASLHF